LLALPATLLGAGAHPAPASAQRVNFAPPEASASAMVSQDVMRGLGAAMISYRAIAARGGWAEVPGNRALKIGDDDDRVALLQRRLRATGDLAGKTQSETYFDETVADAVKAYQRRHGLEPSGVVYGITLRSLNVPIDERLRQLQLNLDRVVELLPRLSAPRYILMNSASFEVQGIDEGRITFASRTVVGKRQTPTPQVSATVQAVNLLPRWHVPATIAERALVPAVRKDPAYLQREHIRVFSSFGGEEIDPAQVNWWGPETQRLVFRQDAGPHNALGLIRLDMPNKHIVYMHDTPLKSLFNYFERAYSAGCVRVQSVLDMAAWLVDGQGGWTRERLQVAIDGGRNETIKLVRPVPVHFIYLTAWTEKGVLHFRNDLYNRDDAPAAAGEADPASRTVAQGLAP
jgi:murein L,D-transpeptidase YcbB/YkuD